MTPPDAIADLVRRHIDFVYATACRQTGDRHLAEDVTQAVFILLLRKARHISNEAAMISWLYTTTRYCSANAKKMLQRRRHYERQSAMNVEQPREKVDPDLLPILDQAIDHLPKSDRLCILLSFMQHQSHEQVAAALGVSKEAARKRIDRAVIKLREFFTARGLVAESVKVAAPAALVESTMNIAALSQSTHALAIAKTVALMTKLKVAAVIGISVLLAGAVTAQVVRQLAAPVVMQVQAPATPASDTADLTGNVSVRCLAVAPWPATDAMWHTIDGKPAEPPPVPQRSDIPPQKLPVYQAYLQVKCPKEASVYFGATPSGASWWSNDKLPDGRGALLAFTVYKPTPSPDVYVAIADGPWQTVARYKMGSPDEVSLLQMPKFGDVTFGPMIEKNGKTTVYVVVKALNGDWRMRCLDPHKTEHLGQEDGTVTGTQIQSSKYDFDLPADQIDTVILETRPYNKQATFKNITLDPANPTKPQITADVKKP